MVTYSVWMTTKVSDHQYDVGVKGHTPINPILVVSEFFLENMNTAFKNARGVRITRRKINFRICDLGLRLHVISVIKIVR